MTETMGDVDNWPTLWFVCKFCTRAYQQPKDLIEHKKKEHAIQFLEDKKRRRTEKSNRKLSVTSSDSTGVIGQEPTKILFCPVNNDICNDDKTNNEMIVTEGSNLAERKIVEKSSEVTVICEADSHSRPEEKKRKKIFKTPRISIPQTFRKISLTRVRNKVTNGSGPCFCSYCHKVYYSQSGLKAHERIHTGERPYKCGYCDEFFTFPIQRIRHQKLLHSIQFLQKNTDKIHSSPSLTAPVKEFEGENSFMWTSMSIFVRRKTVPNGILYSCNFCDQEFSILYDAAEHVLSHTEEEQNSGRGTKSGIKLWRPFTDNEKETSPTKVKRVRKHTHPCPDCGVAFSHRTSVRRHRRKFHKKE